MKKEVVAGAVLALGFVASPEAHSGALPVELKEETMVIEYTVSSGEAAMVVSAEAETRLARVEVRSPGGPPILEMRTDRAPQFSLQGFVVETGEATPAELFAEYPEGVYNLRALTADGRLAFGTAAFSHHLPRTPSIIYPLEGAVDVPSTSLSVSWTADPAVASYRVTLEQHETDLMTAIVSGGTGSFSVPNGMLAPGTRSQLEIMAVGPEGNRTIVEVFFMTE